MAKFEINMDLHGRPAIYTPKYNRPNLGLEKDQAVIVEVLGIYQVAMDDEVDAYFVVVLPNGKCAYTGVEEIQFTDTVVQEDGQS